MARQSKNSRRPGPSENDRARVLRENVMQAARKVFSRYPYSSASMRMIGKEGGFDHSLIHYYFPTKAALFEAVLVEIATELAEANRRWYDGLDASDPRAHLGIHVDRIIEFDLLNPEPFKILFMNLSEAHRHGDLPGFQVILAILQGTRETFEELVKTRVDGETVVRLNRMFANALVNFLGGNQVQAMLLDMAPDSRQYREWVKTTLVEAFAPWIETFVANP